MIDIDMSLNYCYFLIFDDQRHAKVSKKSVKSNVFIYFFPYLCNKNLKFTKVLAVDRHLSHIIIG